MRGLQFHSSMALRMRYGWMVWMDGLDFANAISTFSFLLDLSLFFLEYKEFGCDAMRCG